MGGNAIGGGGFVSPGRQQNTMGGSAIGGGGFGNPSGGSYGSNSGGFSNSFGNNKPSK